MRLLDSKPQPQTELRRSDRLRAAKLTESIEQHHTTHMKLNNLTLKGVCHHALPASWPSTAWRFCAVG